LLRHLPGRRLGWRRGHHCRGPPRSPTIRRSGVRSCRHLGPTLAH